MHTRKSILNPKNLKQQGGGGLYKGLGYIGGTCQFTTLAVQPWSSQPRPHSGRKSTREKPGKDRLVRSKVSAGGMTYLHIALNTTAKNIPPGMPTVCT